MDSDPVRDILKHVTFRNALKTLVLLFLYSIVILFIISIILAMFGVY